MRVCHLIKGLGRGGAEGLLPQTIRASDGVDYSVGYFLPWKAALVGEVASTEARVHCFETRGNLALLASARRVAAWLRDEGADLVHAHLPLAAAVGRLAARSAKVPLVYTEHNLQPRYHPATRWANRWTWGMQQHVVAVSTEVADSIHRHLGDRVPVTVVRNGIEIGPAPSVEVISALRSQWRLPEGVPVIGTVAIMRRQKRLDLWLAAASRIAAARPEAVFILVGDGPLRGEVEAWAASLGLTDRLRLPGLQEDPRPYLATFDLFLSSSEFEGLPLALLEAMAASVPVVATAVGGVPEVLSDPTIGVTVPFRTSEVVRELADEVLALLADPARARSLAAAGRQHVADAFSVDRMAGELETLYRQVLADAGRS